MHPSSPLETICLSDRLKATERTAFECAITSETSCREGRDDCKWSRHNRNIPADPPVTTYSPHCDLTTYIANYSNTKDV
eukprot:scaffold11736_cov159-Ochromonas_danica.AAC.2